MEESSLVTNAVEHLLGPEHSPRGAQPGGTCDSAFKGHSPGHLSLPKEAIRKKKWIKAHKMGLLASVTT